MPKLPSFGSHDDLVCWSRMHAEAGESLEEIVERKELERAATGGTFFWGVGNAPGPIVRQMAKRQMPVRAIFSRMKSRPSALDTSPRSIVIWRRYIDLDGTVRPLPDGALITSRGNSNRGPKQSHYALICHSHDPLELRHGKPFDPKAFRNVGGRQRPVGASQVTVLLFRVLDDGPSDYEANILARLHGSYWVRLNDPRALMESEVDTLATGPMPSEGWMNFARRIRADRELGMYPDDRQGSLF